MFIGFHHADLPNKIKKKIVDALNKNRISVVVSTTTLARGVNLSIRTVVIEVKTQTGYIKQSLFEQISGRAGRFKKQNKGFSFIIAGNETEKRSLTQKYIEGQLEPIELAYFIGDQINLEPFTYQVLIELSIRPQEIEELIELFSNYYFAIGISDIKSHLSTALNRALETLKNVELIQKGMKNVISLTKCGYFFMEYLFLRFKFNEFYQIIHIFRKIKNNEKDFSLSPKNRFFFPKLIRQVTSFLENDIYVTNVTNIGAHKEKAKKNVEDYVLKNCNEKVNGNDRRERTFVCFMEFIDGRSLKSIESDYNASMPSIRSRIADKMSKIFIILKGLVNKFLEFTPIENKRKWEYILEAYKERSINGVPFECLPIIQATKGKGNIARENSLRIIKSIARDSPEATDYGFLKNIKDFKFIDGVGPGRDKVIKEKLDDILKLQERLIKELEYIGIKFNFQNTKNRP